MGPPGLAPSLGLVTGTATGETTLVIGCGNLLRGDDAVGPVLVRHLAALGTPPGVRLADAGTAGMDVAFAMRGRDRVVIVDASTGSGHPPGTLFRVPGERLAQLPPPEGINLHAFRWDQALAFAHWLLKGDYPREVVVWLVEVASLRHGEPLSPVVEKTMRDLADRLLVELTPPGPTPPGPTPPGPTPPGPTPPAPTPPGDAP